MFANNEELNEYIRESLSLKWICEDDKYYLALCLNGQPFDKIRFAPY